MFESQVAEAYQRGAVQHAEIDDFQRELSAGSPSAIVDYFTMVLASSTYPDSFPRQSSLMYLNLSNSLLSMIFLPLRLFLRQAPKICEDKR